MKLYRVENERGFGPYSPAFRDERSTEEQREMLKDMLDDHNHKSQKEHPMPTEDGIDFSIMWEPSTIYGFGSKKQLLEWFEGYFSVLEEAGYEVVAYRCPKNLVKFGNHQVAFPREAAVRLGRV